LIGVYKNRTVKFERIALYFSHYNNFDGADNLHSGSSLVSFYEINDR